MRAERLVLNGRSVEENLGKISAWANKLTDTINYNLEHGEGMTKEEILELTSSIKNDLTQVIVSKTGGSV